MALVECKECGREISDAAAACPHCGAPAVKEIHCSNCGALLDAKNAFCPGCGAKVSGNNAGGVNVQPQVDLRGKDRVTTAILALVLGSCGVHYFYLGKVTGGILTIILTFCTCGTWSLITFVQAILMLTMNDVDFASKYVNNDKTLPLF